MPPALIKKVCLLVGCGLLLCGQSGCVDLFLHEANIQYYEWYREKPFGSIALRPDQSIYSFTFTPLREDAYSFKLKLPTGDTMEAKDEDDEHVHKIRLRCWVEFWRGKERFAKYTLVNGHGHGELGRSTAGTKKPAVVEFCEFGLLKALPTSTEYRRRESLGLIDKQPGLTQRKPDALEKWEALAPPWDRPLLEKGVTYRVTIRFEGVDEFLRAFGPTALELSPSYWDYGYHGI